MVQVSIANVGQTGRVSRRPSHTFHVRSRPWQIQPFMIAPVLPGETMKSLLMQARVVSDPVNNPLIGWWNEYYFFYVKHRDLEARDLLTSMMLDQTTDLSSLDEADKIEHYHNKTTGDAIDWVDLCLTRVVDEYFRYEGENAATASIGNLPAAGVAVTNYLDSVVNDSDYTDISTDVDLTSTTPGEGDGTAAVKVSEIEAAMRMWEFQRHNNLTDMTYEDYLRTHGVSIPSAAELHKPELIRFVRDWSYPTNTVDPSDGAPSSALSWSVAERADKDRFFREPGFIFGVSVVRPKVYMRNLTTAAVQMLDNAFAWLPAVMSTDAFTSLKKMDAGEAPLSVNTDDYWVDLKDLFLYGDQFINFALADTGANIIDLPLADLQKRYADSDDANSVFVDSDGSGGKNLIRQDGVVNLNILGKQVDTTPSNIGT